MGTENNKDIYNRYNNRLIFFLIEMSYWAGFYAKWKSEKDISISVGISITLVSLFCNMMAILMMIHLYTPYAIIDSFPQISESGIITPVERLNLKWSLMPIFCVIIYFLTQAIYKRASKKELINYFQTMPLRRQSRGKSIFIMYSLCSIILVFVFGIQLTNKRDVLREDDSQSIRIERLEQIRRSMEQRDSLSIKRI